MSEWQTIDSAPVGVEAADIADRLRNIALIMRGFGGTERIDGKAWERVTELADRLDSLAQQPVGVAVASEPLEYWLYTATDVQLRELFDSHPAVAERLRAALAQQPAVVDGDFIKRVADSLIAKGWDIDPDCDGTGVVQLREAVISALAAQPGGAE